MDIGIISEVIKNSYGIKNEVIKNLESSVGNVYDVVSTNSKYIVKIYNDFNHVCRMIELFEKLNDFGIIVPKIIKNLANMDYVLIDNEYIVVYEFLNGKKY